jgi:hypothetical protein
MKFLSLIVPVSLMCIDIQLKTIYSSIQKYQGTSGFHWNNTTGATIGTAAEENVWNEYSKIKVSANTILFYIIMILLTSISIYLFSPMLLFDPFALKGGIYSQNSNRFCLYLVPKGDMCTYHPLLLV